MSQRAIDPDRVREWYNGRPGAGQLPPPRSAEPDPEPDPEPALEPGPEPDPDDLCWLGLRDVLLDRLQASGIETISELCTRTPEDLCAIQGFGPRKLEQVTVALLRLGRSLTPSPAGSPREREAYWKAYDRAYNQSYQRAYDSAHQGGWPERARVASAHLRALDQAEYDQTRTWLREHGHILWDSGTGSGDEDEPPATGPALEAEDPRGEAPGEPRPGPP